MSDHPGDTPQKSESGDVDPPSLFQTPQEIATINVGGKSFKIHKSLLVKDSGYFEKALNGPFVEGQTQTIYLGDDVCPVEFGIYIDILYHSYVFESYTSLPPSSYFNDASSGRQMLGLWRLADRFLNKRILKMAEASLGTFMRRYSVSEWERRYTSGFYDNEKLSYSVFRLQRYYQYCVDHNMPQKEDLASVAANMPMQLLAKHHDELDVNFREMVMKKLTKRFENPQLKRPKQS